MGALREPIDLSGGPSSAAADAALAWARDCLPAAQAVPASSANAATLAVTPLQPRIRLTSRVSVFTPASREPRFYTHSSRSRLADGEFGKRPLAPAILQGADNPWRKSRLLQSVVMRCGARAVGRPCCVRIG